MMLSLNFENSIIEEHKYLSERNPRKAHLTEYVVICTLVSAYFD
jgi:hypothetical protein